MERSSSRTHEPSGRGEPAWAFAYIAVPVLTHLFGLHEVAYVEVVVAGKDGRTDEELVLQVEALGDSGAAVLWDSYSRLRDDDLVDLRLHLADQLQDLIAESPQGWGQLRAFSRSDLA